MYIEVTIGSSAPIIYKLDKSVFVIGSHKTSDIVIKAIGISRKHLTLTIEDDAVFVTDEGSTNGTFIDEKKLEAGVKVPFTTFFPVKLGDNVFLTLHQSDESQKKPHLEKDERTVVLKSQERSQSHTTAAKTEKKDKKFYPGYLIPIILVAGMAYTLISNEFESDEPVAEPVSNVAPSKRPEPPKPPQVHANELTSKDSFNTLLNDLKCMTDNEKYLCETIPGANEEKWGVVQVGTMLNIMVDGEKYFKKSESFFQNTPNDFDLYQAAMAYFIIDHLPNLDYERLADYKLTICLFKNDNGVKEPVVAAAIIPESLKQFKARYHSEHLAPLFNDGAAALNFTKEYYQVY
jgi:hypothetical protein